MKRILLLVLTALLLLTACSKDELAVIVLDADGYGCTNTETGVHYTVLSPAFEPAKSAAAQGTYTNEKTGAKTTYYEIPSLDPARYLTDDMQNVWCAEDILPKASALTPVALLICEEGAISVEVTRLTAADDGATVDALLTLWFEGEAARLPEGAKTYMYRVKMMSEELPNIFYCFSFAVWGEEAYFYDLFSSRAVLVPRALAEKFPKK